MEEKPTTIKAPKEKVLRCPKGHTVSYLGSEWWLFSMGSNARTKACPQCFTEWVEANVPVMKEVKE